MEFATRIMCVLLNALVYCCNVEMILNQIKRLIDMIICIYCCKNQNEATFIGVEHVMPRLMGKFENNPTLIKQVCDSCNSKVFNKLENTFKEDTEEGIFYQMFNFEKSFQIRIKYNLVKTKFSAGLGDDFFNEIFPFFDYQDGDWKVVFLPQIKIKKYGDDGFIILLVDLLKKHRPGSSKFQAIKNFLAGTKGEDIAIFAGSNEETDDSKLQDAKDLLSSLGIIYNEKKKKYISVDKDRKDQFVISMDGSIGNDVGRVIAKIAFNYFAYCAVQSGNSEILFHENFSRIKSYILGEIDHPIKEVITSISNEPIIFEEKINNMRHVGHVVTFGEKNGNIISEVSFLGKRVYTLSLGLILPELRKANFGSGHLFDPINKKVMGLTQNFLKWGNGVEIGFGLFNRI